VHWSRLMGVFTMTCGIFDTRGRCAPKPVELGFLLARLIGATGWSLSIPDSPIKTLPVDSQAVFVGLF